MSNENNDLVQLSSKKFLGLCVLLSAGVLWLGARQPLPGWVMAAEVLVTILALFVTGSIRYRLDKNALTYGAGLVITATFWTFWSPLKKAAVTAEGGSFGAALWETVQHHALTFKGVDHLIHLDTMLFILGLTFFVAVIAQTRLLETVSFGVLSKARGRLVPTVAFLTAVVALASGVLDGVSMIGLMIRTLVILLFLAKAKDDSVIYAVMVSTVVTTVCGMYLAYGEPPNLIMKANLHPHLDNAFFLRYCAPAAVGAYFIVFWNVKKRLAGKKVDLAKLDLLDRHTADVRFLQVSRHGEMITPLEFALAHADDLGSHKDAVLKRLHQGVPLGEALVNEHFPREKRIRLLDKYLDAGLADTLDDYYVHVFGRNDHKADESAVQLARTMDRVAGERRFAQKIGVLSFAPFIGLLIVHAINHDIPLFVASFAGFAAAFLGIAALPKTRRLALREAWHEYKEYLFLFPLFLSITLLQKTGFFDLLSNLLHVGIDRLGAATVGYAQFLFCTVLSALLDNNVVADFAGRALLGLKVELIHLFAMAQIAGYALGGCWTHIGSAQSVVAYAFIQKEVNPRFTPFQWIKEMTPVILEIAVWMTIVVYGEGLLLPWLH
jgi:Na+/H+ antiporter NhaD/arsenite permease-like protein